MAKNAAEKLTANSLTNFYVSASGSSALFVAAPQHGPERGCWLFSTRPLLGTRRRSSSGSSSRRARNECFATPARRASEGSGRPSLALRVCVGPFDVAERVAPVHTLAAGRRVCSSSGLPQARLARLAAGVEIRCARYELIELSALIAVNGQSFVEGQGRLSEASISQYWSVSRSRFDRWAADPENRWATAAIRRGEDTGHLAARAAGAGGDSHGRDVDSHLDRRGLPARPAARVQLRVACRPQRVPGTPGGPQSGVELHVPRPGTRLGSRPGHQPHAEPQRAVDGYAVGVPDAAVRRCQGGIRRETCGRFRRKRPRPFSPAQRETVVAVAAHGDPEQLRRLPGREALPTGI